MINLIITKDKISAIKKASLIIIDQLKTKPNSSICLASGSTMLPLYKLLIKLNKKNKVDFSLASFFNLDEYIGLPKKNKNLYQNWLRENFLNHINTKEENLIFLDPFSKNISKMCRDYEEVMNKKKIDLQLLGLGLNCHIGFNEPPTSLDSRTRRVELSEATRNYNSKFFSSKSKVPTHAITLGIKTILKSKKIILLSIDAKKAIPTTKTLEEKIDPNFPSTYLRKHRNVDFIIDKKAASLLTGPK